MPSHKLVCPDNICATVIVRCPLVSALFISKISLTELSHSCNSSVADLKFKTSFSFFSAIPFALFFILIGLVTAYLTNYQIIRLFPYVYLTISLLKNDYL